MDAQSVPAPVPTSPKNSRFPKLNKKSIIFILAVAILILLIPLILLSYSKKQTGPKPEPPKAKTWEIILSYDNNTEALSLKKLSVLNQEILADFRSATYSPYELVVQDKEERALFRTKVNITEQIIYNFPYEPESSSSALPTQISHLETILYIPYRPSANKILINKNYSPILQINIPPEVAFNLIPEAFAQTSPASCGTMQVVLISDNYTDPSQFHQDVEQLKTIFNSTEPYASTNPKIFDFKEFYNTTPLGCINGISPDYQRNRFTGCIQNPQIQQIGRSKFPSASKFIVVVNNPNAETVDGSLLGTTNDIGGDIAVFTNRQDGVPKFPVAAHEFLGHSVGLLYDRYVSKDPTYGLGLLLNNIRSNCTNNPNGETFWKTAGVQGVFPGCSNPTYYGSSPLSCPIYNPFSNFQNGGSQSSLMSLYRCGGNTFDSVEQAWINQKVIPLYQTSCQQPTSVPVPTSPLVPTTPVIIPTNPPTGGGGLIQYTLPVVQTQTPSNIQSTSVTANADIISVEGGYIRIRGFEYFDTSIPASEAQSLKNARPGTYTSNSNDKYEKEGPGNYGITPYSININGLLPNHTYAIRAYVVNDNTTHGYDVSLAGWGNWIEFTTRAQTEGSTNNVTPSPTSTPAGISNEGYGVSFKSLDCTLSGNNQVYNCN